MTALHARGEVELHVVAQVVKTELVVRSIGDVGGVGRLPLEIIHVVLNATDLESEETMDLSHPFRVTRSKIIVDGDHINTASGERVQIRRKSGDQGLTFAGAHLGNLSLMQHESANHLHIKVPHAGRSLAGFAHYGKCFRKKLVQDFPFAVLAIVFVARVFDGILNPRLEMSGLLAKLVVRKFLDFGFERVDLFDDGTNRFQESLVAATENFGQDFIETCHNCCTLRANSADSSPIEVECNLRLYGSEKLPASGSSHHCQTTENQLWKGDFIDCRLSRAICTEHDRFAVSGELR